MTIGGVPAIEFLHRRVKIWGGRDGVQHATPGVVCGFSSGRKVLVKPRGHKTTISVLPAAIEPLWSANDDIRQKYKLVTNKEEPAAEAPAAVPEVPQAPEVPEAPQAPEQQPNNDMPHDTPTTMPTEPTPAPAETTASAAVSMKITVPQPVITIRDHSVNWYPAYQDYVNLLQADQADLELIAEANAALRERQATKDAAVAALKAIGVEVTVPGEEKPAAQAPAANPPQAIRKRKAVRRCSAADNDARIRNLGKRFCEMLASSPGGELRFTRGGCERECGLRLETLLSRSALLSKEFGLVLTPSMGGNKRSYFVKITKP